MAERNGRKVRKVTGVHLETIHTPANYSQEELEHACLIAAYLNRGKLVLLKPPAEQ